MLLTVPAVVAAAGVVLPLCLRSPEDPMATHAFHEKNSNALSSDRQVPDTRERR